VVTSAMDHHLVGQVCRPSVHRLCRAPSRCRYTPFTSALGPPRAAFGADSCGDAGELRSGEGGEGLSTMVLMVFLEFRAGSRPRASTLSSVCVRSPCSTALATFESYDRLWAAVPVPANEFHRRGSGRRQVGAGDARALLGLAAPIRKKKKKKKNKKNEKKREKKKKTAALRWVPTSAWRKKRG